MKARTIFKISGVLVIFMIGLVFLFYARTNRDFAKAENAYNHGDFETAKLFYEKGIGGLEKFPKIGEKFKGASSLAGVWSVYYQGYYDSEQYKLAEEIINQELANSNYKDQFYNLKALICWQKGVDLFIELGKKAATSQELDQLLEEAKTSSGEAVKNNDGNDEDIKYNYEFFRKPKEELKKNMQQAAQQKSQDREMKKKAEQLAKEKQIKPNKQGDQQQDQEKKVDKKKDNAQKLVPMEKKERDQAEQETQSDTPKKKKKKG
jgi:hypothetical protein